MGNPVIERTCHVLWFGDPMPGAYEAQLATFADLNPDWTIRRWDEDAVRTMGLRNQAWFDRAARYVPADSRYQLMSDLARLEILARHGGAYIDADYAWFRPLTPTLDEAPTGALITCWERQYRHVANGFIAAPPGHPLLLEAVQSTPTWIRRRRRGVRANRITGPSGQWTHLVRRHQHDVHVLHQRTLHAVPWNHPERVATFDPDTHPDAVGLHLWGHQRTLRGLAS